jgi:hypothetical protein
MSATSHGAAQGSQDPPWPASDRALARAHCRRPWDPVGNIKLDKEKSRKKIDGLAALVNAIAGAIAYGEGPSVYETRGILWF